MSSLIEYKLRKYIYLGHQYSMYVVPSIRSTFWPKKYQDDVTGVRIIGKIVKKNQLTEINSIVPIILKIKKENKLQDDRLLIFALAVCAKFNLDQCTKMVADAYAAVSLICTDGLKLLMFVKFCDIAKDILHDDKYLPNRSSSSGNGFRKAIRNWYFEKDPLLVTKQIVKYTSYDSYNHQNLMHLIHMSSIIPSRKIFIAYVEHGMKRVEELFGPTYKNNSINEVKEEQIKSIYTYLKQICSMRNMDEKQLLNEIKQNKWEPEVIPQNMITNSTVLISLFAQYPLKTLLANTFWFSKHKVFSNVETRDTAIKKFISCFNDSTKLKASQIHPIETFVQYILCSRTNEGIQKLYKNNLKKKIDEVSIACDSTEESSPKKFKSETESQNNQILEKTKNIYVENCQLKIKINKSTLDSSVLNFKNYIEQVVLNQTQSEVVKSDDHINKKSTDLVLLNPTMKVVNRLLQFLSKNLLDKTLKNLKPSGHRIIISYDSRPYIKRTFCKGRNLITVHEAITLITLSLIYPESLQNKPTIRDIDEPGKQNYLKIDFDYKSKPLSFANMESVLFTTPPNGNSEWDKKITPQVYPLSTMEWAIENNEEYDVFVFLGTEKMNLNKMKEATSKYQTFFNNKPVKVIVCCLNGQHPNQKCLSRGNCLFVAGFEETVCNIITSYINKEF